MCSSWFFLCWLTGAQRQTSFEGTEFQHCCWLFYWETVSVARQAVQLLDEVKKTWNASVSVKCKPLFSVDGLTKKADMETCMSSAHSQRPEFQEQPTHDRHSFGNRSGLFQGATHSWYFPQSCSWDLLLLVGQRASLLSKISLSFFFLAYPILFTQSLSCISCRSLGLPLHSLLWFSQPVIWRWFWRLLTNIFT